jgi:hypothetical protein
MPTMPTREQLRMEFDAAVHEINQARGSAGANLTSEFYARIGDSVFEAGYSALEDACGPKGTKDAPSTPPRLHVVSAPVGAGKTSFALALIAAVVRHHEREEGRKQCAPSPDCSATAPFGCLWVVDQMAKADEMFRELNALLPGRVACWHTDQDPKCKQPTKVFQPTTRFTKDDLQHYAVAVVTHAFFMGKGGHKARQVLHRRRTQLRALTVIDERPDEVTVFDVEYSAAERVRELVKADERHADTAGPHMDALVRLMFPRTFGGGSLERFTDDGAWKAADLEWFSTEEASACLRDIRTPDSSVEAVLGFARALAQGCGFVGRVGSGEQSTRFMGYDNKLTRMPGMVLLDATADIDGVQQLCPWRQHQEPIQARYDNLSIIHVPAHSKMRLSKYLAQVKNRRAYVAWMTSVIREQMAPGQLGLVVCKKTLFDNENIPDWPEGDQRHKEVRSYREQFCWDIEGRKLCAVHWGTGIGDNTWMLADVVFLFDEFHLPRRTIIATAQGLQHLKATQGDLSKMKTLNSKAKKVDTLQEGHLLRWHKQMALRGRARTYDSKGICGRQKLVVSGDLTRLLANHDSLFPGATITVVKPRSARQGQAEALLEVLSRPGLPSTITTKWIGQQMHTPWRDVGKNVMPQEDVQRAIANLGWQYTPGRGRAGGAFTRPSRVPSLDQGPELGIVGVALGSEGVGEAEPLLWGTGGQVGSRDFVSLAAATVSAAEVPVMASSPSVAAMA